MDRRTFLAATGAAGATLAMTSNTSAQDASNGARDFYELRRYRFDTPEQAAAFDKFAASVAVPALNRAGVGPVGAFTAPDDAASPLFVLLRYPSLDSFASLTAKLLGDTAFMNDGADFLNVEYTSPTYARVESALLRAFETMPALKTPTTSPNRVFQLRTYESPTLLAAQTKIKMFNTAEIDILRRTGINPVFFGETLAGAAMPNLTYMVGFDDAAAQDAAWKAFRDHPDWKSLSSQPEYAKKNLVSNITNIVLKPAPYSQI